VKPGTLVEIEMDDMEHVSHGWESFKDIAGQDRTAYRCAGYLISHTKTWTVVGSVTNGFLRVPHPHRRNPVHEAVAPMKPTQAGRLLAFIRANPGCTTMDIQLGMRPFIANPRARISDLRAAGIVVDCRKDDRGVARYTVRERAEQLVAFG
jgi:hypothetical protein